MWSIYESTRNAESPGREVRKVYSKVHVIYSVNLNNRLTANNTRF